MTISRAILSQAERRSPGGRLLLAVFILVLLVVGLLVMFPFFFAFTAGLKTSTEVAEPGLLLPRVANWGNYAEAWSRLNMVGMFKNSLIVGMGGVILRLLVCSMAAYSLSRLKPIGKRVIEAMILITFALPTIAYIVPLYLTLVKLPIIHISLLNNYWGLWIPYAANAFTILVLKNTFDAIPQDIYDAARIDGAGEVPLFFQFTLPLSSSILVVLGLLAFIGMWGDFLLPLLILRDPELQTVSVRLFNLTRQFSLNLYMAGAFMAMVPPTIVAIVLQRYIKGGLTF